MSPTFPHTHRAIKMLTSSFQQERSIGYSYCHWQPGLQHETYIEDASDSLRFEKLSTGRVVIAAEIQKLRQNLGRESTCRRYLLGRLLQAVPADPTNLPVLELVVMATHETRILPLSFPIHLVHLPHHTNSSPTLKTPLSLSTPPQTHQNQTLASSTDLATPLQFPNPKHTFTSALSHNQPNSSLPCLFPCLPPTSLTNPAPPPPYSPRLNSLIPRTFPCQSIPPPCMSECADLGGAAASRARAGHGDGAAMATTTMTEWRWR